MRRLAALLFVFAARSAFADVNTLLSETPRAMALAGAYTALSEDGAALSYNPAGLTRADGSYVALAFLLSRPFFNDETGGGRVDLDSPHDESYGIHLAWSPTTVLDGNLGFGFSVLLPHARALAFEVHRFEEPYFVLYDNSIELLQVRVGLAYELFDQLSFGASALLIAGLNGNVELEAPFQGNDPEDIDPTKRTVVALDAILPNRTYFTFGAQYRPAPGLTFGLSYRESTFVPIRLPIDFTIQILGLMPIRTVATLDVKVKYSPEQITGGVAYQLRPDLLLAFDLAFARFTKYEIPYGNVSLDRRFTPDITLLPPRVPKTSLRNVWIPRIGVEWSPDEAWKLRGGYYFFRSFIRESDAPVLDSDKHSVTFGGSYALGKLFLPDESTSLDLTAAFQAVFFPSRTTAEHVHSGVVLATTFGAEFRY
jgi:long-subunit fatty acid transport protein